ncbi:microfibril-associated glycoprotein 4-like [Clytia hemisphaerica]|uniref:microfibril-associated glycoprotein 4-like n=1 Tax=Clytia hemisphaerica TaxID=252671 RepID=UPI0034D63E8A
MANRKTFHLQILFFNIFVQNSSQQNLQHTSSTFRKIADNTSIQRLTPFVNQTVSSELQCLMQQFEFHTIVEIEQDSNAFKCKFFKERYSKEITVLKQGSSIYELDSPIQLCQQLKIQTDGTHTVRVYSKQVQVFCEMSRHEGGWTTLQRRFDGSTDFNRNWTDYKRGFGNADSEYWIGLENIYQITNTFKNVMLKIEATKFDGTSNYMIFEHFYIENEKKLYLLHCGLFKEGASFAKDDWLYHDGQYFSTPDRDNEDYQPMHCARDTNKGGGWFNACSRINFNGIYIDHEQRDLYSIFWNKLTSRSSLKNISLSIKVEN